MLKRRPGRDVLVALAVGLFAALVMASNWTAPTFWESDGLFYEAQKQEVEGVPRWQALHSVFASDLASQLKEAESDEPPRLRRIGNPAWVNYSSRFYRRRWAIPVAAAAVDPVFGVDSLKRIASLGFVAAAVLLYLLLRRRFGMLISSGVAVGCLLLPPLRHAGTEPSTDSWGLALLCAGLICASLTVDRGRRWLIPWVAVVVVLSFTRDLTMVLVVAAAWLAFRQRARTAVALVGSGLLASIPAPLVAGAPFRENLAYVIDDYRVPHDTSWGFLLGRYPGRLVDVIGEDLAYPFKFAIPYPMVLALLLVLAGFVALVVLRGRGDSFVTLMRGAFVGGVLTIVLSINFTNWRLELALLPAAAVGVAMLVQRLLAAIPPGRADFLRATAGPPPGEGAEEAAPG
jgi:hypothetical protein